MADTSWLDNAQWADLPAAAGKDWMASAAWADAPPPPDPRTAVTGNPVTQAIANNPVTQFVTGAASAPAQVADTLAPAPTPDQQQMPAIDDVPRLDAQGNAAPIPTRGDVATLQHDTAALNFAAAESNQNAPAWLKHASFADAVSDQPAQAFDAKFGQGTAEHYLGTDLNPPTAPAGPATFSRDWWAQQLGATGDQPYGEGLGYLIDNPVTRGLGQFARGTDAALSELGARGAGALGLTDAQQFLQREAAGDVNAGQQLAAPQGSIGGAVTQLGAKLGGDLLLAASTGGTGAEVQGARAAGTGLMDAAKVAARSPHARIAATLGASQASQEAAALEAQGQNVSNTQLAGMAALDTAANLVPLKGEWNIPTRVGAGATLGAGSAVASNAAAGQPLSAGVVPSTLIGGVLGVLPGARAPSLADANAAAGARVRFDDRMNLLRDSVARQDFEERMNQAAQQGGGFIHPDIVTQLAQSVADEHGTSIAELLRAPKTPLEAGAVAADAALGEARQAVAATTPDIPANPIDATPPAVSEAGTATPQIVTGRVGGGDYGASVGSFNQGNRRQLLVDPNGGYFWGDYALGYGTGDSAGQILVSGEHANFEPATFAHSKDARDAAANTPFDKTSPDGGAPAPIAPDLAPRAPALPEVPANVSREDLVQQWRDARTDSEKQAAAARIAAFDQNAQTASATIQPPAPYDWQTALAAQEGLSEPQRTALGARYRRAERTLPDFTNTLHEIASDVGGDAIVAPLKGVPRAVAKVLSDYRGDASQIKDLVRGTIAVPNLQDVGTVLAKLREKYGDPIKENGSLDPNQPAPFANGYRDLNTVWKVNGHPVEIQVNLPEMLAAKKKAHALYEQVSAIQRSAAGRRLTDAEKQRIADLDAAQAAIYQPAWDAAIRRMNSSRGINVASLRNSAPETGLPSGQVDQSYASSEANRPSGNTPNTALGPNSGSEAGRTSASDMATTSSEILPQTAPRNSDWTAFGPDSGTLGVPRSEMPQIKGQDRENFMRFLESRGISGQEADVPAADLRPTQAEFSPSMVDRFAQTGPLNERRVLVSSDNYVLDGHHQALAHKRLGTDVPVTRLDAPIRDLLAAANEFPAVQRSAGATPAGPEAVTTHAGAGNPIVELPLADLHLSNDVPQFKSGANDEGVVEPLGGTFDRRGTGPIQVWRRNDGRLEVISGRHRLDLARRSGEQSIPAQVYDESSGFDARQAAALDAELNIRDGQGKVADYVQYFQSPAFDGAEGRQAAESRGLLARATGRRAYTIATQGDPELIAAHRAGQLSDEAAVQIAQAAPNDPALQALGMKQVQTGRSITSAVNTMRALGSMRGDRASQGDIFGFDDSAIRDAEAMGKTAAAHQTDINKRLSAISGAAKRPELARAEGIDVHDPAAIQRRIGELRAERDAWENWATDPDKVAQVRQEAGLKPMPERAEPEPEPPPPIDDRTGTMFSRDANDRATSDMFGAPTVRERVRAAQESKDAERNGRVGGRVDTGDGGLFDGQRPEQTDIEGQRRSQEAEPAPAKFDAAQVRDAAAKAWGNRFITKLERAGILHFIDTDKAVELGLGTREELRGVKGIYSDGNAYVLADQVKSIDAVPGIVVHEAGLHFGYDRLTTPQDRQALRTRVNRAVAMGDADVIKAWRHAEKVGTPARALHEETMAYLVENAPGNSIAQRVVDAVKRGLNRAGVPMNLLESDSEAIRRAARDMLRRAAKGEAPGKLRVDENGASDWRASEIGGVPVFSRDVAARRSRDLLGHDDSEVAQARREAAAARATVLNKLAAEGYPQGAVGWTGNPNSYEGFRGGVQRAVAGLADRYDPIKRMQIAITGGDANAVGDMANVYRLENLMHGRTGDRLARLDRDDVRPLIKSMRQLHVSSDLLNDYLLARHAPERNARIASINKDMPDGGSGITTEQAKAFMAGTAEGVYSGKKLTPALREKLEMLAKRVDRMRTETLDTLERSGQITPELAAQLRKAYKYYVPLRGKASDVEGAAQPSSGGFGGRGIDIKGKPVRRALGRGESNLAPPHILGEIIGDAQRAIVQAEKARVGRSLLRLALEHPNPEVWQVEPVELEWKFSESTGEAYLGTRKPTNDQDVLTVMHAGTPYHVRLVDPRLQEAVMNMDTRSAEFMVHWIGKMNRWLSAAFTRFNPAFMPINMTRDLLLGTVGMTAEHGVGQAASTLKYYLPAMRAAWRDFGGKHAGDASVPDAQKTMDDWSREYAEAGGRTGIAMADKPEVLAKNLASSVKTGLEILGETTLHPATWGKPLEATGRALSYLKPVVDVVERANDATENAMRLAAYVARRKGGATPEAAADYAKNITVNFNRKGRWGPVLNSLFLFYNASLQGSRRIYQLVKDHPVGMVAFLGSLAALQAQQATVLMSRKGDDGISDWDAIPDYKKSTALIIALPGKGNYFALPMPYEFGFITYAGGRMTQRVIEHDPTQKHDNVAADLAVGFLHSFSPVPLEQGLTGLVPAPLQAFMDVRANKDDLGREITFGEDPNGYDKPQSSLGRPGVPAPYVWLSRELNKLGGGDPDWRPPPLAPSITDVSPDSLQYLANFFAGGLGSFVSGSWRTTESALAGVYQAKQDGQTAIDWTKLASEMPILSRFGIQTNVNRARSDRFYDIRDEMDRTKAMIQDKIDHGDFAGARQVAQDAGIFGDGWTIGMNRNGSPSTRVHSVDGQPKRTLTVEAAPGTMAGAYQEAEYGINVRRGGQSYLIQPGVRDYNRMIHADMGLPGTQRQRSVKQLQDQRGGLMGAFLNFYEHRQAQLDPNASR